MLHLLRACGGRRVLAILFLLCALPTGLGCALLTPIGMFPDEVWHVARADGLVSGHIAATPWPGPRPPQMINLGTMVDIGIFQLLTTPEIADAAPDRPVPAADRRQAGAIVWAHRTTFCPTQMMAYFPIFYAPAALSLWGGQTLGLSPLRSFMLGRVAMLLCYVAAGTAALALARCGGPLLFALLTLPTAIDLGASFNQDGLIIASCALAAALLTRTTGPRRLAAVVLLIAVVSAKTPYAALLLLCLTPLRAPGLRRRAGLVLLAGLLPYWWLLHIAHGGLMIYPHAPYHPGPFWPGGQAMWLSDVQASYNIRVLLAHPAEILLLPLHAVLPQWAGFWRMFFGSVSCDHVPVGGWEYPLLLLGLAAAALGGLAGGRQAGIAGVDAGLAGLAVFGGFIGMELAMYVTFSPAGWAMVEGVQARYFLPLVPGAIFLLGWAGGLLPGAARLGRVPQGLFALPAMLMAVVNIYALPACIFHIFHMPGP
jgi:hypothetical protein